MDIDKMSERELRAGMKEARTTIEMVMRSYDELMPGAGGLVVDIALMNESCMAAERFMRKYEGG